MALMEEDFEMREGRVDTTPGFTIHSKNFELKFIAGYQEGRVSRVLEHQTDWMEVMMIMLENLKEFPTSTAKATEGMANSLEDWINSHEGAEALNIKVLATTEEKAYFNEPFGIKKSLQISFTDRFNTKVLFHVKKRKVITSLKELCAEVVADHLEKEEDVERSVEGLEVPVTVRNEVLEACRNDWSSRYYWENVDFCDLSIEELLLSMREGSNHTVVSIS